MRNLSQIPIDTSGFPGMSSWTFSNKSIHFDAVIIYISAILNNVHDHDKIQGHTNQLNKTSKNFLAMSFKNL